MNNFIIAFLASSSLVAWAEGASNPRLTDLTAEWEVHPEPMLSGFHNLYCPHVLHEPEDPEFPFKMWFFGYAAEEHNPDHPPGGDQIYFARGRSLTDWEVYAGNGEWEREMDPRRYAPVIKGDPAPYDGMANGDPSVVRRNGVYYMAFSSVGFDLRPDEDGIERLYLVNCVLGATSPDGIHWEKTDAPIAIWEHEFDRPWEIVDGEIPPAPDEYYGGYHRPSLMFDEGRWKLWFDYFHPGTFVSMGYAENRGDFRDSDDWTIVRAGKEPLIKDWPNPSVVRHKDTYYAFSDAPGYPLEWGGDTRQITMAASPDGLDWTIQGHIRPHGRASSHVPVARVFHIDGRDWLYLFYAWKPAQQPDELWDFRYKELRYMRRPLDELEGE